MSLLSSLSFEMKSRTILVCLLCLLCLGEVKKCGTYLLIMHFGGYNVPFVIDGHVIVIKYSSLKLFKCFRMLALSALFLMKKFAFRAAFAFG